MLRDRTVSAAPRTLAVRAALAVAGTIMLAVSAKIAVPVGPVPITLQTLALPLLVLALGRNLAVTSTVLYLAAGLAGLGVLAPVGGWLSLGYVVMYPIAAYAIGTLLDGGLKTTWAGRWAAIAAGDALVFAGGAAWLMIFGHLTIAQTLALGVAPFVIGDLLKISIASALPSQAAKIAAAFRI